MLIEIQIKRTNVKTHLVIRFKLHTSFLKQGLLTCNNLYENAIYRENVDHKCIVIDYLYAHN